jgi:hypothetical protein
VALRRGLFDHAPAVVEAGALVLVLVEAVLDGPESSSVLA